MRKGPKLFTCPKCRHTYLGHEPLPDCPRCGYDYREKHGFRWDVLVYLLTIMGLMSFFWVSTYYRENVRVPAASSDRPADDQEKLPGGSRGVPFEGPYERGR
jgi:rubredoxin